MDIHSKSGYPSSALSNFSPHPFVFDLIQCNSMEGLLQSFKCKYPHIQPEICKLVGLAAKFHGKKYKWWRTGCLYWNGIAFERNSQMYQDILDRAYTAMYDQSESFRNALRATGAGTPLTHSIGKNNPKNTILTTSEFCGRLMKLRDFGHIFSS